MKDSKNLPLSEDARQSGQAPTLTNSVCNGGLEPKWPAPWALNGPEQLVSASPRVARSLALAAAIDSSARIVAQRQQQQHMLASAKGTVLQGYFSSPRNPFERIQALTQPAAAAVLTYMQKNAIDTAAFQAALTSDEDKGTLEDWTRTHLQLSLQQILHPQTQALPLEWLTETHAQTNGTGPQLLITPSPQGTPTSSQDDDYVPAESIGASDYVIDNSTSSFTVKGQSYPIDRQTRSDIRAATMVSNAYLGHIGGSATIVNPQSVLTDVIKKTGENEGQAKNARDVANALTAAERNRRPQTYQGKVVMHGPDISFTGTPQSQMGWMPGTAAANTMMGYASGLGGSAHPVGSTKTRFLVKEQNGHFAHSMQGRKARKARELAEREREAAMEAYAGYVAQRDHERDQRVIEVMQRTGSSEITEKETGVSEEDVMEIWANYQASGSDASDAADELNEQDALNGE